MVNRGPHRSALSKEAIEHFAIKAAEKVRTKQARIVDWDLIKNKERAFTQPEKHYWDSISMGKKKLCGLKKQNKKNY
jgi:hypothetical protein